MKPEEVDSWKLVVLEHDESSEEIGNFFEKIWQEGVTRKKIGQIRMHSKEAITNKIENAVKDLEGRILTLYGMGSFHHYTYGLCNTIAKKRSKNYMYTHVDEHSDSLYTNDGSLNCAAFVRNILKEPGAKSLMLIGSDIKLYDKPNYASVYQEEITSENAKTILKEELRKKSQLDVYCSLDLDVLKKTEIKTNYPQGTLELKHLLQVLDVIKQEKDLISADILGYYKLGIRLRPEWATNEISLLAYVAVAAKITGKDTKELEALHNYFKAKLAEERTCPLNNVENMFRYSKEFVRITEQLRV